MVSRVLALLLCLLSAQAWGATYHLCPDTDSADVDINYGTEDGSDESNCYDGFSDAETTAAVAPDDVVELHGTFYNERGYAWISWAAGAQVTFQCGSDCLFWYSVNVAGNNTVAGTPYGQTTGSSWQLVSGTTNVWKKGVGSTPYMMWVNGVRIPNAPTIPATADDAGATAAITGDEQFTVIAAALDGFTRTLYFKGDLSSDMRVNNQSLYTAVNALGSFVVNGKNYISIDGLNVRGYRPNINEQGGLFIQGCTGCAVTNLKAWENMTGLKTQNNTGLRVSGDACEIYDNIAGGVNLGGQSQLTAATGSPILISAISNVAGTTPGGQIDTSAAHGLTSGEKVIVAQATGLTALNDVEKTATVVDADSFTIATDTSAMGAYTANTGVIYVQRTDTNSAFNGCDIHHNGGYPRYNTVDINFTQDGDGFGVGYYGGTVTGLKLAGNKFRYNGPRRALLAAESGDVSRGSGLLFSTTFTMNVSALRVIGNEFIGNHRYNLSIDDTSSVVISGNLLRGVISYNATAADAGQARIIGLASSSYTFANNLIEGESGSHGMFINNTQASSAFVISNNIFGALTKSTLSSPWDGSLYVFSANANLTESHNRLISAPGDGFFKRVSTQYTSVAAWQSASSQGANDSVIADPGFVGGTSPATAAGFCLESDSALLGAGTYIGAWMRGYNGEHFDTSPPIGARGLCRNRPPTGVTRSLSVDKPLAN